MDEIEAYLSGDKLYGDDFSQDQIDEWFNDEKQGYYNLAGQTREEYHYGYHAINYHHGFKWLPEKRFRSVLGIGSAFGDELSPIANKCNNITILEPARGFEVSEIEGTPVRYVEPQASGELPFVDGAFELVTCFGVLHHIPNVSTVIQEISRCLAPDGVALIREPIISMGDWRTPRQGLTKRERGIPVDILRKCINSAGLEVSREKKCMFSLTSSFFGMCMDNAYNSRLVVLCDQVFSFWPYWSNRYHAKTVVEKLRFTSAYFVVKKPH